VVVTQLVTHRLGPGEGGHQVKSENAR
jgi:hypothetical protein